MKWNEYESNEMKQIDKSGNEMNMNRIDKTSEKLTISTSSIPFKSDSS